MENKRKEGKEGIDPGGQGRPTVAPRALHTRAGAVVCPNPGPSLAFSQEPEDTEGGSA